MFICVYDDGDSVCVPYGWDGDCDGAIVGVADDDIALFSSRAEARAAIRISTCHARLLQAQGKPANTDFLDGIKCVKIRKLRPKPELKNRGDVT